VTDAPETAAPRTGAEGPLRLGVIGAGAWAIERLARGRIEEVSRG